MKVADLVRAMESIAPPHLAEEWDNVGLLVGDPDRCIDGGVMLTIDLTEAVLDEARKSSVQAVLAYHPPLFKAIRRLHVAQGSTATQRVIHRAIESGMAIYSSHTALDAATGGITDWLADGMQGDGASGGGDRRALKPIATDLTARVKIVTFLPENGVERARGALASAGAGIIGEYELCSFGSLGTGTFMGKMGTRPVIGRAGNFESAPEVRLEMICARRSLALALQTLRQFHPYEEPAIDVYALEPQPDRSVGVGRRVTLDRPATLRQLAERVKRHIGVDAVQMAAAPGVDADATPLERVAVVPGSGGDLAPLAIADNCQVYLTGEIKHHELMATLSSGMSVIVGGHTNTERGYMPVLAGRLGGLLPGLHVSVSAMDRDPLALV